MTTVHRWSRWKWFHRICSWWIRFVKRMVHAWDNRIDLAHNIKSGSEWNGRMSKVTSKPCDSIHDISIQYTSIFNSKSWKVVYIALFGLNQTNVDQCTSVACDTSSYTSIPPLCEVDVEIYDEILTLARFVYIADISCKYVKLHQSNCLYVQICRLPAPLLVWVLRPSMDRVQ